MLDPIGGEQSVASGKEATSDRPTSVVIFGASGDLTRRKLVPALFSQCLKGRIPPGLNIIGTARSRFTHDSFRERMREGMEQLAGLRPQQTDWDAFAGRLWYVPADASDPAGLAKVLTFLGGLEAGPAHRLYYLATAPSHFPVIIEQLGKLGMAEETDGWRRIVVEKPFGRDLASAQSLNEVIHAVFQEHQVYRIDHYLGKDTAQNILYFRFLNTIFEPVWNRNYIDHVQITVAEAIDVGHRAGYYDTAGVLRDMFQNHLLQLLTLIAMEPPAMFEADAVRNEKVKVLRAIRPIEVGDMVCAQYRGYDQTEGADPESRTPTFAALKLLIDNWRWQGVPFYLRSGKAMQEKTSEVVIEFKAPPHVLFDLPEGYQLTPNFLSLCIQPDEGVHLRFETKVPGAPRETRSVDMEFHYPSSFGGTPLPDAYERLLLDVISGDASLFTRSDEIEMAWRLVDPLQAAWDGAAVGSPPLTYEQGSWGPEEATRFLAQDGRVWRRGCGHGDNH